MSKVEILAPAGSMESLIAAIKGGANAIYLAGKSFGARASSSNFTNEELVETIKYAHLNNVKVYVTVNILIFSDEIDDVLTFVKFLYENNVDGIIVQDFGLLYLVRKMYPSLKVVASTQMNVHNAQHAKLLKSLGVERIVVAREISYSQIKRIKDEVDIEVEAFGHGALCVSFSGNCLMSSFIGGRSGNRGRCAQPCRLPYTLESNKGFKSENRYWMSPKDLMTIKDIDKIFESKIDSIKIEGRLKNKEYVYMTTNIYQEKIIEYEKHYKIKLNEDDIKTLSVLFNRGWTSGYINEVKSYDLINEIRPNHQGINLGEVISYSVGKAKIKLKDNLVINDGIRILDEDEDIGFIVTRIIKDGRSVNKASINDIVELDVNKEVKVGSPVLKTTDYLLQNEIEQKLNEFKKVRPISIKFNAFINEYPSLTIIDQITNLKVSVKGVERAEVATSRGLSKERISEQLSKTGSSPFYLNDVNIDMDEQLYLKIASLNKLRNEAIEKLTNLIIKKEEEKIINPKPTFNYLNNEDDVNLFVKVHNLNQLKAAILEGISHIYYDDLLTLNEALKYKDKANIIPVLNRVNYEFKDEVNEDTYLINELGSFNKYHNSKTLIGDTYLNVTNEYTLASLFELGFKRLTLSGELSNTQIEGMLTNFKKLTKSDANVEVIVYGRLDLMYTRNCPITNATSVKKEKCGLCLKDDYKLIDRKGYAFPIVGNVSNCHVRILNSKRLNLINQIDELKSYGVKFFRLEFTIEKEDEVRTIIQEFKKAVNRENHNLKLNGVTYGHYFKKID